MAWPVELGYRERDSGTRREPLPFQMRIDSTPLRINVDPDAELDAVEERYLDLVAQRGAAQRRVSSPKPLNAPRSRARCAAKRDSGP